MHAIPGESMSSPRCASGRSVGSDAPDGGTILGSGRTEPCATRLSCTTQSGAQFKMYKLFNSGIFHTLSVDQEELKPQKAKRTRETEISRKWGALSIYYLCF